MKIYKELPVEMSIRKSHLSHLCPFLLPFTDKFNG